MVTIETQLAKCNVNTEAQIMYYLEGDANDADYIGTLETDNLTAEDLQYYRVLLHIINDGIFECHHWEEENPFEEYGVGEDYHDFDEEDEDAEDFDEESAEERNMEKIQLQLAYDFISEKLPCDPGWCEKCHSVTSFRVFIFSESISGELDGSDVTDEEICEVYERTCTDY